MRSFKNAQEQNSLKAAQWVELFRSLVESVFDTVNERQSREALSR